MHNSKTRGTHNLTGDNKGAGGLTGETQKQSSRVWTTEKDTRHRKQGGLHGRPHSCKCKKRSTVVWSRNVPRRSWTHLTTEHEAALHRVRTTLMEGTVHTHLQSGRHIGERKAFEVGQET